MGSVSRGFYFGLAGLVVLACAMAIGWNALSVYAKNTQPGSAAAWYSMSPTTSGDAGDRAAVDKTALDGARQCAKSMSKAFHAAAEQVLPAVVTITTKPTVAKVSRGLRSLPEDGDDSMEGNPFGFNGSPFGDMLKDPQMRKFFKDFHGMPNIPHGVSSSGSGVIVDLSGIVLTNNHVVAGGGDVTVRLSDGRGFKATEIKTDPKTDLASVCRKKRLEPRFPA